MSVFQPDPAGNRPAGERVRAVVVRLPPEQAGGGGVIGCHVEARNPDTTLVHHDWTWCQLCERVYRTEAWLRRHWRCPTARCTGLLGDAFPWESQHFGPRGRHPRYPVVPGHGDWYPFL